jgi:hypothetical protein
MKMKEANDQEDGEEADHNCAKNACWCPAASNKFGENTDNSRNNQPYNELRKGNRHIFVSWNIKAENNYGISRSSSKTIFTGQQTQQR